MLESYNNYCNIIALQLHPQKQSPANNLASLHHALSVFSRRLPLIQGSNCSPQRAMLRFGRQSWFETHTHIPPPSSLTFSSGVCVTTSTCSANGGTTIDGACPADAANVKCCTKSPCGSGGNCRWTSDCAGTSASNQCPGPGAFMCCSSSASGFGGYAAPLIPSVGACKQVAVDGAKKIVAAFPGRVREVFCIRDCACPGTSDHCCGKATDMMCSDGGGVSTTWNAFSL